jgi:hypothetical protein
MLALAGLLAATVMVSGVAVAGLGAVNARTQELYRHNVLTTQAIAELQARLDDAAESALQLLLFERPADRSRLQVELGGGSCRRPRRPTGPPGRGSWASRPRPRSSGWSSRCC